MTPRDEPKPLVWVGPSRRELKAMPRGVQRAMGIALFYAQLGGVHPSARPMKGGALGGVTEIREDLRGDTFRVTYTARLGDVVYVLHAFQKKSTQGIQTPARVLRLIEDHYGQARVLHARRRTTGEEGKR